MSFILIGALLFILASFGFMIVLGLWTYADAKVRTDNPGLWTLIVLLAPNLIGLIIYLLVGRNKEIKSPGNYKKALIVSVVCFIIASILMIVSFIWLIIADMNVSTYDGVKIGSTESYWNDEWKVSFKTAGAEYSRNPNLSSEDLNAVHVTGNCSDGKLYLRITQGINVKIIDISDSFSEYIDMSDFSPGKVKLDIYNEEAKNAKVTVSWRR